MMNLTFADIQNFLNLSSSSFYWKPADGNLGGTFLQGLMSINLLEEKWLLCVITFHIMLAGLAVVFRKNTTYIFCHLIVLLLLCYLGEKLNEWAAENYKMFSSHQFFDSGGVFIIAIWCCPLVLISFMCLAFLLFETANLLIAVKRKELTRKNK